MQVNDNDERKQSRGDGAADKVDDDETVYHIDYHDHGLHYL